MTAFRKWDEPRTVKLTVDDFLCLNDAGALDAYAKSELIDGVIVAMNAQFSTHARLQSRLFRRLADAVEQTMPGFETWVEASVSIPPGNMPQPDIVVTNFRAPADRATVPVDTVALIVEVADTTARFDLSTKAPLYATAGIPEYWVADIAAAVVHRLSAPVAGRYTVQDRVAFGTPLAAVTIPGLTVATDRFLD